MAKVGILSSLNYKLNVQHCLLWASYQNGKMQEMAKAVPASVYFHWRDTAHVEFPGIKTTPANFGIACSALLQFFHMSAMEKTPMMLPSKAADSVWHTWLAHDKDGLESFLDMHLGRSIVHTENIAMAPNGAGSPYQRMADTWRAAHDYDSNVQFVGKLPSIFEADKLTGIPTGFWYDRDPEDHRAGYFHAMDDKGAPTLERQGLRMLSWQHIYEVMTPVRQAQADREMVRHYVEPLEQSGKHAAAMAALGIGVGTTAAVYLVAQEAIAQETLARKEQSTGGDGGGVMAYDSSSSSDSGGGSCGGGCGGGCGG